MSNMALAMALAQNAKKITKAPEQQQDTPMMDAPMAHVAPGTPVDGLQRPPLQRKERPEGDEAIPVFQHLIPAIFVPLKEDLLAPLEPPKDNAERLQRMLKSVDANETAVRGNLAWTVCDPLRQYLLCTLYVLTAMQFEREARRRVAEAKKTYDFSQPQPTEPISFGEEDRLIASMSAAPLPEHQYNAQPAQLAEWHKRIEPVYGYLRPSEKATHDVLMTANNGACDIEDYSVRHIKPIRERLNHELGGR